MRPMNIHGFTGPRAEKNPPPVLFQSDGKRGLNQRLNFTNLCIALHKL